MGKTEREFIAHIGEPIERLVGSGTTQTVVRSREVLVKINGAVIETIQAADDETDIHEKLIARGFIPGTRTGDQIVVTRKKTGSKNIVLGVAALVIILAMIVIWLINIFGGEDSPKGGSGYAVVACKNLVKNQLKAPSTAKFSETTASGSGASWQSSGVVDSQNSFGAMIRTPFTCQLTYNESADSWSGTARLSQ